MNALTSPGTWRAAFAEGLVTFIFVTLGIGSAGVVFSIADELTTAGVIAIAFGHGAGITLGIAAVGRFSGGHINPAVTIAQFVTGKISAARGIAYIAAQLAGAALGAGLVRYIFDINNLGVHSLNADILASTGRGFTFELVLTAFLVFTIFAVAVDRRGNANLAPIVVGGAVFLIHLAAIPVTGASVNPARSFGPALIWGEWADHWVYWIAPIAGGIIGATAYAIVFGGRDAGTTFSKIRLDDEPEPDAGARPTTQLQAERQ